MNTNKECPFCNDRIKNSVITESENFYVIYNIAPVLPGHCMIIPKSHKPSILSLSDVEHIEMMNLLKSFTDALCRAFKTKDFNWSIQEGETAGQTIPHMHFHILVRNHGDLNEPGDWYKVLHDNGAIDSRLRDRLTPSEITEAVNFIRGYL